MFFQPTHYRLTSAITAGLFALGLSGAAPAAEPFSHGWALDPAGSELRITSVKKGNIAETSTFATFSGKIDESGAAEIRILTDSIDTTIDLRNVRMRFLFFETFKFPEAVITTRIDAAQLADLPQVRRKTIQLDYTISLHGITAQRSDRVMVTLLDNDTVAIATAGPVYLKLADFDLEAGRQKLEEAANVTIVPLGTVTFDFLFRRTRPGGTVPVTPVADAAVDGGSPPTVGETEVLDAAACTGRFEILSRTGNIYFGSGSADLQNESLPLLQSLLDIVQRCPGMRIQVAGHTDSDGASSANQALSEARAKAVTQYLSTNGVSQGRVQAVGFGESKPVVPNDSNANKARNRRIEFTVLN